MFVKNKNTIEYFNKKVAHVISQDLKDSFIDAGQWFWIKSDSAHCLWVHKAPILI